MALVNLLLLGTLASAQSHRLLPGFQAGYVGELIPRRLFDNISECSILDTCGECFGTGYVLCDGTGCFNPDDGEQCCKGGTMCVGLDSSCCQKGPGKPGKDGTIAYPSDTPGDEEEEDDSETSWMCDTSMTGEECCSIGGNDIHWCSGSYPSNTCYNTTLQICCEDGHICEDEDCCDIVDSTPTTPWLTETTARPTSTSASTSNSASSTTTASAPESDSGSEGGTGTDSSATTTGPSDDSSSPTPTDAGEKLATVKGAFVLIGALAVGLLVL